MSSKKRRSKGMPASTSIKVDEQAHGWLLFLSDAYGVTVSNVVKTLVLNAHPDIEVKVEEARKIRQRENQVKSTVKPPIDVKFEDSNGSK